MSQYVDAAEAGLLLDRAKTGVGAIFGAKGLDAGKLVQFNTGSPESVASPAHT